MGPATAVAAALEVASRPPSVYLSIREEHEPIVQRWYDNRGDRRRMTRMVIGDAGGEGRGEPAYLPSASRPLRLGPADAERIEALYAHGGPFTPDMFSAYQLENGVFFGVENEAGELIAVGGTHIVDWEAGVGAIGNMYTHPAQRGRGYATQVLGAIVDTLRSRRLATIILNVDQRNEGARRLYERFGFRIHCPYIEGVAVLRE